MTLPDTLNKQWPNDQNIKYQNYLYNHVNCPSVPTIKVNTTQTLYNTTVQSVCVYKQMSKHFALVITSSILGKITDVIEHL